MTEELNKNESQELEILECDSCGEKFEEGDFPFQSDYNEDSDKNYCENCYYEADDNIGSIHRLTTDGEVLKTYLFSYRIHSDNEGSEEYDYARSLTWKSTDAWRGFYDFTDKNISGFKKVKDDWFGSMDGYNLDNEGELLQELFNKAEAGEVEGIPFDIIMVFTRTSNVFSTGYEVHIPEDIDEKEFSEFLIAFKDGGHKKWTNTDNK